MAGNPLVEPEFVAHLFAPLDGPNAAEALRRVREMWEHCSRHFGMTQPIFEAGLTADLPRDPGEHPDGALAGLQDPAVQFQAVVRREHDVLNFSFAVAALSAVARGGPRLSDASPPGWFEFTRWWNMLAGGDSGALLGGATVYLAKTADPRGADVRSAVPPQDDDGAEWWTRRFGLRGFAAWEVGALGQQPLRRLVLLGGLDEDEQLSRFAWSAGDTALPPLGRYLLHSAKLRYLARVRGDGRPMTRLRERTEARLDEATGLLHDPSANGQSATLAGALAADEAELAATLAKLRQMRRSTEIARSNMARALAEPLPADRELADWLDNLLLDDGELMEATRERAARVRAIRGNPPAAPPSPDTVLAPPVHVPAPAHHGEPVVEHRVGFNVDVVSYNSRSTPQQHRVQARLAGMVERVLRGLGLDVHQTDRQAAGDGMMVVLPAYVPAHQALPRLLHGWRAQLVADNAANPDDRIRLRLSVGAGPFTPAAIGFTGNAIIEIGRMLDSPTLRTAVQEHPDADVVALVADRLHQDVVVERYPGLTGEEFEPVSVEVKTYHRSAWLWTGGRRVA